MTEAEETAYTLGHRIALTQVLSVVVRELGYEASEASAARWIVEREAAVNQLRQVCEEFGDNDWQDDLHLGDVIEKHLHRNLASPAVERWTAEELADIKQRGSERARRMGVPAPAVEIAPPEQVAVKTLKSPRDRAAEIMTMPDGKVSWRLRGMSFGGKPIDFEDRIADAIAEAETEAYELGRLGEPFAQGSVMYLPSGDGINGASPAASVEVAPTELPWWTFHDANCALRKTGGDRGLCTCLSKSHPQSRLTAGEPTGPKPSVDVEALRALPRYNFADPRDYQTQWTLRPVNIVPDPEGDWVGWSDLAALWPPQTGSLK